MGICLHPRDAEREVWQLPQRKRHEHRADADGGDHPFVQSVSASVIWQCDHGGTAGNSAILHDGTLVTLPGFGQLDLTTSQSSLGVPSWLPIQISQLALKMGQFQRKSCGLYIICRPALRPQWAPARRKWLDHRSRD